MYRNRTPHFPNFRLGTVLIQWLSIIGVLFCLGLLLSNTTTFGAQLRDALKPVFEKVLSKR